MIKNEAVKALPIRLVRGGNYGEWAKDAALSQEKHGGNHRPGG